MQRFDNTVNNYLSFLDDNEYLSAAISLFLILYAGLAAPQLPEHIARLFDNDLFKLLIFFLIAYTARKNPTVAIIAAVGVMVTLNVLTKYKVNLQIVSLVQEEEAAAAQEAALEGMANTHDVQPEAVMEETDAVPVELAMEPPCAKKANFKDSFYPQYVNMKPDAYRARYTGDDISGFDSTSKYASI